MHVLEGILIGISVICHLFSYAEFSLARKQVQYFIANININKRVLIKNNGIF